MLDRGREALSNVLGGLDSKPMISRLKPGAYEPSNEAIGDEIDVNDKRVSHGLVPLPAATTYANQVLDKLKAASGVTNVPGKVFVVANDQLDAGATPDGNIFVSLGYLRNLQNEDQLAALLAHELSHVLLHHHDSSWIGRKQKEMMSFFEDSALLKNTLENVVSGNNATTKPYTSGQQETLDRMLLLVKLNDRALQPAWGRRQEAEADRLGVDLMIKAGYSVADGTLPWLGKVAEWDAQQAKLRAELAAERQASIEALSSQGRIDASAKMALDGAMKDVLGEMARAHDDGSKRLEEIDVYLDKVHANSEVARKATVAPYTQFMQQRDVKATVDGYREAFMARNQVVDRKFAQALPTLRRLTGGGVIASHALPNYLLFEAQRGGSSGAANEQVLRRSLAASEPTWEPFDSAAAYYGARNQKAAITEIGRNALAKFSNAPSAYPRLVALYTRYGMKDEAANVVVECRRKQAQMRLACEKALKK
ncbi:M48 family metalloprotease [Variovorax sp. LT2P21]|uniref:M48 family metalloprotease n=1 Tax=Variovorax sp. LT2P21 TaxID=3443731 RepID=UPI003F480DF0